MLDKNMDLLMSCVAAAFPFDVGVAAARLVSDDNLIAVAPTCRQCEQTLVKVLHAGVETEQFCPLSVTAT